MSTRRFVGVTLRAAPLVLIASSIVGCAQIDNLLGRNQDDEPIELSVSHGPCLPTFGRNVESVAIDRAGDTILYVSNERPESLPNEASWSSSDDRAVYLVERLSDVNFQRDFIVRTWDPGPNDVIGVRPTNEPNRSGLPTIALQEQIRSVQLDEAGSRFVLGVTRTGTRYFGNLAQLYTGMVPTDMTSELAPGDGLVPIPLNSIGQTEGIIDYRLTADGSKVAAIVGKENEVRIYDLAQQSLTVYDLGEEGETVVDTITPSQAESGGWVGLPPVATSLGDTRRAAVRAANIVWSPSGDRLALTRDEGIGDSSLSILDVASGEVEVVRVFRDSTLPQVAWADDGASLFVIMTRLGVPTVFGNGELRQIEAKADGAEIGGGANLPRLPGWRSVPTDVLAMDGDSVFFVWENRLHRMDGQGDEFAGALWPPPVVSCRGEYCDEPPDLLVRSRPLPARDADVVAFVGQDVAGRHVVLRLDATQDACTREPTPAPDAGGEGEGDGDGEAEGQGEAEGEGEG